MSGLTPSLPVWAQWFAALAVPIAALVGVGLGVVNYQLARQRRCDDLFDRRYKYYMRLREYYLLNCDDFLYIHPGDREEIWPGIPMGQISLSTEARFLFGKEVETFVRELHWKDGPQLNPRPRPNINHEPISPEKLEETWRAQRLAYPTPEWFEKPFLKYMALVE